MISNVSIYTLHTTMYHKGVPVDMHNGPGKGLQGEGRIHAVPFPLAVFADDGRDDRGDL